MQANEVFRMFTGTSAVQTVPLNVWGNPKLYYIESSANNYVLQENILDESAEIEPISLQMIRLSRLLKAVYRETGSNFPEFIPTTQNEFFIANNNASAWHLSECISGNLSNTVTANLLPAELFGKALGKFHKLCLRSDAGNYITANNSYTILSNEIEKLKQNLSPNTKKYEAYLNSKLASVKELENSIQIGEIPKRVSHNNIALHYFIPSNKANELILTGLCKVNINSCLFDLGNLALAVQGINQTNLTTNHAFDLRKLESVLVGYLDEALAFLSIDETSNIFSGISYCLLNNLVELLKKVSSSGLENSTNLQLCEKLWTISTEFDAKLHEIEDFIETITRAHLRKQVLSLKSLL